MRNLTSPVLAALQLAALSLLLAACSSSPAPETTVPDAEAAPEAETVAAAAPEPEAVEEEIEYGSFTEDQLFEAIISEIGARRGHLGEAGENYFNLAFDTRDLGIIRRAIQFASANEDNNALLQLGLLWAEVAPQDPQPHLMLAYEFLEGGNFEQALNHMGRLVDLGGEFDFTNLAARTGELDPRIRNQLIDSMGQLQQEYSERRSIHLALVQLLAQNQRFDEALTELDALVERHGDAAMLVRLRAQIQQSNGQSEAMRRTLREGVEAFPEDRNLRLSWGRQLIQQEDFRAARDQFQILVDQNATDWETWYSLALLDMEMERYDSAKDILMRLVGVDQRADESQYYLGFIHEEQGNLSRAIGHYRQVRIGTNNYLAAQQQATRLSIELGELDEAHSWLVSQSRGQPRLEILFTTVESGLLIQAGHNERARELLDAALDEHPGNTDLLFARVLLNDSEGNLAGSERDLRNIISQQPDDSRALNHLGYMLANQTDRYQEALELIERAIALSPDDPAIIDSLGWAQYKLGDYEAALENLRRAYAAFPDHEVASHLGEVLWQMGREEEAREIWQQGLQQTPDSDIINEAMDRLVPGR